MTLVFRGAGKQPVSNQEPLAAQPFVQTFLFLSDIRPHSADALAAEDRRRFDVILIAAEIVEKLQAALEAFQAVADELATAPR